MPNSKKGNRVIGHQPLFTFKKRKPATFDKGMFSDLPWFTRSINCEKKLTKGVEEWKVRRHMVVKKPYLKKPPYSDTAISLRNSTWERINHDISVEQAINDGVQLYYLEPDDANREKVTFIIPAENNEPMIERVCFI